MRIVSGIYRGRTLCEFKGSAVRPTSDMVRESLFNILQGKVTGKTFLDLFCGTGAVGIEALSRGAKQVVFNDLSRDSIALTKKNLEKIGATDYQISQSDGLGYLQSTQSKFDFVFIDPPYATDLGVRAVELASRVLNDGGLIIYENQTPFDGQVLGLTVTDRRRYGRAHLTFFSKE